MSFFFLIVSFFTHNKNHSLFSFIFGIRKKRIRNKCKIKSANVNLHDYCRNNIYLHSFCMSDASSFLIKMCKYDNFLYYTPSNVTTSFIFGDSGLMFLMALEWSGGFVEVIVVAMAMFVAMEWLRCGFFFVGLVMTMGLYWWSIWCWVCVGKFVFGKHIWREREREE